MKKLFLSDSDALLLNRKERALYFILSVFFFALYMPGVTWLYNVCMWAFFVCSFFFNSPAEKWKLLKQRKALLVIMLFFLLNVLSALISNDGEEGISFTGLRISLFVIPLSISSLHFNSALKDRIVSAFANTTFCAAAGRKPCERLFQGDKKRLI